MLRVVEPRARMVGAPASRPREAGDEAGSDAGRSPGAPRDEALADEARRRLREQGIIPIEPDDRVAAFLDPDEILVAVRRSASIERRQHPRGGDPGLRGDLYLTSHRLVHLGRARVVYELEEIREAVVASRQLLLVVGDNRGVAIDVGDPRLLRVEIAAARAAARAGEPLVRVETDTPD
jgi:hypothetical protein